ncbi:hypothetical protein ACHAXN_013411 [Cyclotella atomus]
MSTIKCITFVSTLLLASAQVSTLPRRLRRGAVVSSETNELVQDKEFGRQLEEMSMSLSMPSSMSVDLQQAGIEFMPIDETASMAEEATTAEPSYYPTYLPTSSPIGTSPTAPPVPTKSPSYWPTYIPSAQPVGVNPTKAPAPTTPPSYYPTYYPSQKPVGPTNVSLSVSPFCTIALSNHEYD